MSGCPVVLVGGRVLGVMASGIVDTVTKRLVATLAIYTLEVVDVMKRWLQLPDNPDNVRNICTFFPPFFLSGFVKKRFLLLTCSALSFIYFSVLLRIQLQSTR